MAVVDFLFLLFSFIVRLIKCDFLTNNQRPFRALMQRFLSTGAEIAGILHLLERMHLRKGATEHDGTGSFSSVDADASGPMTVA